VSNNYAKIVRDNLKKIYEQPMIELVRALHLNLSAQLVRFVLTGSGSEARGRRV
jgi:hypothetical protein